MLALVVALALGGTPDGGEVLVGGDGPLPVDEIRKVVHHHQRDVRYCYERELVRAPNLAGKVSIHFVIGPEGKVTSTSTEKTDLPAAVVECVRGVVRKFEFLKPKGGGIVKVTYPFVFKPEPELPR